MGTRAAVGTLTNTRITHNMWVAKRHLNIADQLDDTGQAAGVTANGVVECIPVRTGDIVLLAWINVLTATTGAAAGDLGNGTDVDHFCDNQALDVTTCETTQSAAAGGPWYVPSADTIDLKVVDAGVTAGKLEICALIVRV
jgi:hypothetical protein